MKSTEIVNVPWSLNQVHRGSLMTDELVKHLINDINKIRPVQNNAFEEINIKLENTSKKERKFVKPSTTPPPFCKSCKLKMLLLQKFHYQLKISPL